MVIGSRAVSADDCISAPDGMGNVFKRHSLSVTLEHSSFSLWFFLGLWVDDICSTIWVVWDEEAIFEFAGYWGRVNWETQSWRGALVSPAAGSSPLCGFS